MNQQPQPSADDPTSEEGEAAEPENRNWLYRITRSGVGAFVLAQEEIESRLRRLTERGSGEALDDSVEEPKLPSEPSEPSEESEEQEAVPATVERRPIGDYIDRTVANILHTINLPTRADVDELTRKIDALAASVEALRES